MHSLEGDEVVIKMEYGDALRHSATIIHAMEHISYLKLS